ncbi:MAG: hypothetical protein HIU93_07075 [Acidobacteria bacterium]|nr:hypothetical protein [Acidobacteriota bacterium]MBW4045729.1 hypothetical protein [Acidobacteriota bacterium]
MSHSADRPLSNKQRAFVTLLLLLGTLISYVVIRFMNPDNAFPQEQDQTYTSAPHDHSSQPSARP